MRSVLVWGDKIVDRDGERKPVYDLAFNPDGSQLIIACGLFVIVYETQSFKLLETLKAHKDNVYAVSYCQDGKRFASGGADKTVIVWSNKWEPIIKYTHSESIQCICHNPITGHVTSGSMSDYGMWSLDQKAVNKYKSGGRILSMSWTVDGQFLALGMYAGHVSIRNHIGEEIMKFDRNGSPVWSLVWTSVTKDQLQPQLQQTQQHTNTKLPQNLNSQSEASQQVIDLLAIADWVQTKSGHNMTLYDKSGSSGFKVSFDPCSVDFFMGNELLAVGGSNKQVQLYTKTGVKIGVVCEREKWIWKVCAKPKSNNQIAVASQDGSIAIYQVSFGTVHGMYQDLYAYRERMCSVVVFDLSTRRTFHVRCNDYVKKLAIYKEYLAIQVPHAIHLYRRKAGQDEYLLEKSIENNLDFSLLVVTSHNLILCLEKRLQLLSTDGETEREWFLPALIRYMKVIGGEERNEGMLVGLKNGEIYLVYLQNPFPIVVTSMQNPIRCLDLNQTKMKLAAVDESGTCSVFDMKTKKIIYSETGATSVAWNIDHEDLLCFSGQNFVSIKADNMPAHSQKLSGFVVGFKGSKVFCLDGVNMESIDVPQSASMLAHLKKKQLLDAYQIACLGVTDADWKRLAVEALENLEFAIARKAFVRIKDFKHLDLIKNLERRLKELKEDRSVIQADILAYQGKFDDAARMYIQAGQNQRAIDMYTDLNMWDQAAALAEDFKEGKEDLLKKKAHHQHEKKDLLSAAKTYIEIGEFAQALSIYTQSKLYDEVIAVVRLLAKSDLKLLAKCADYFQKAEKYDFAAETLFKMGKLNELVELYAKMGKWDAALQLATDYPGVETLVYVPYGLWLAREGRYQEALQFLAKGGRNDLAIDVLVQLVDFATQEKRFEDATFLCWTVAFKFLEGIPNDVARLEDLDGSQQELLKKYQYYSQLAEYFHAYGPIFHYVKDPFTDFVPDALFHMARYLFHVDLQHSDSMYGIHRYISSSYISHALVKLCRQVGAYKMGRFVAERLQEKLYLEPKLKGEFKSNWLYLKSRPFVDVDLILPVCWSCETTNSLLNTDFVQSAKTKDGCSQEKCQKCKVQFVYSMYSFENLGIIEIEPEPGMDEQEVIQLLQTEVPRIKQQSSDVQDQLDNKPHYQTENAQTFVLEFNDGNHEDQTDEHGDKRISENGNEILSREELLQLRPSSVYIVKSIRPKLIPTRYYRKALPEVRVKMCEHCHKFFHVEDFELAVCRTGKCPFCKTNINNDE